jgi:hypothetical protein
MLISIRWRKLRFFKSALGVGVAAFAVTCAATMAQASGFLGGSFDLSVYYTTAVLPGGGSPSDTAAFANPTNPLITGANLLGTGVYNGDLNFALPTGGTNTVGAFLQSGGGSFVSSGYNLGLSTGGTSLFDSTNNMSKTGFVGATVMVFTANLGAGTEMGVVIHDDGATFRDGWDGTGTWGSTAVTHFSTFVGGSAAPSSPNVSPYGTGAGGALTGVFELIYVEANNLPADLLVSGLNCDCADTPLPAALPLFATGLGALGLLGWRRKRKAAALAA